MTREEAISLIRHGVDFLRASGFDRAPTQLEEVLTTLAPAVRYEPPTQEEVGDVEFAWAGKDGRWLLLNGETIRLNWRDDTYQWSNNGLGLTMWVQRSAIPEGGA